MQNSRWNNALGNERALAGCMTKETRVSRQYGLIVFLMKAIVCCFTVFTNPHAYADANIVVRFLKWLAVSAIFTREAFTRNLLIKITREFFLHIPAQKVLSSGWNWNKQICFLIRVQIRRRCLRCVMDIFNLF